MRVESSHRIVFDSPTAAVHVNDGQINLLGGTAEFNELLTGSASGRIAGRCAIFAHGSIDNHGSMAFSAGVTDVFGAVTNAAGSKTIVTGNSTTTFYDAVTNDPASSIVVSSGSTIVFLSQVAGFAPFTGAGAERFRS